MFSKDIIRSDAFLDLPISSQALYFHLGMEADDRGYVNNPKTVIRSIGATVGDLEQLANKRFILVRDEGLILIKHWKMNNYIQNDRFVETKFTDDLQKLFFDENNSYTEKHTKKPCIQNVSMLDTQDSKELDKSKTSKELDNNDKTDITDKTDKTIFEKMEMSKNPFVNYLQSQKILDESDLMIVPSLENYFQSLFKGYSKNDFEKWNERYGNIQIAVKYVCLWIKEMISEKKIKDKYSYIVTSIESSLNRNYDYDFKKVL